MNKLGCTCRHCFPRKSGTQIDMDSSGFLTVGQEEHNEYINAFNDVNLLVVRSNNDIRFLAGAGTADVMYYCLKYVTNVQNEIQLFFCYLMIEVRRKKLK